MLVRIAGWIRDRFPQYISRRHEAQRSTNTPDEVHDNPGSIEQGLTGIDLSLPIFDGLSTDPDQHLIDLDTESMERHADVRMYFWIIGHSLQEAETEYAQPIFRPEDHESRLVYDDDLVRKGREHLKESRIKGDGYYLSPTRIGQEMLADNVPGSPWYRLPAIGIARAIVDGELDALDDEGAFLGDEGYHWRIAGVLKTNIRVPVLWAQCFQDGMVPGTDGWNWSLGGEYFASYHPAAQVDDPTRGQVIGGLFAGLLSNAHSPCDVKLCIDLMEATWPDLFAIKEPEATRAEPVSEDVKAKLDTGNMHDFFHGKKEYRRKKFLSLSLPSLRPSK